MEEKEKEKEKKGRKKEKKMPDQTLFYDVYMCVSNINALSLLYIYI